MERDLARYWPVFLLPTAAAFAIGFLIPFAMGLYLSFCDFTTLSNATFVGFGNYVRAFEDSGGFTHALWYTALFAGLSTVVINLFGLTVALLLVRGFRGTNLFRTVFFMPNLIGIYFHLSHCQQMLQIFSYSYPPASAPKLYGSIILKYLYSDVTVTASINRVRQVSSPSCSIKAATFSAFF